MVLTKKNHNLRTVKGLRRFIFYTVLRFIVLPIDKLLEVGVVYNKLRDKKIILFSEYDLKKHGLSVAEFWSQMGL